MKTIKEYTKLTEQNACSKSRTFEGVELIEKVQSENYMRAAVIISTIRCALMYGIRDQNAVMQYMRTRYPECGFKNYQQKQATLWWDHKRVMRYITSENRKPYFPKEDTVMLHGQPVMVRPTLAFITGKDTVEYVVIKIGAPNMTQTGRQNAFQKQMQLYMLHLYGRQHGYRNITASFYFLKKSTDTTAWNACSQSFFGGGGNIVQIKDIYDPESSHNELDDKMEDILQKYEDGIPAEEQQPETCEHCKKYDLCKYALPPVEITEDENERKASTAPVTFSAQQQQAIAFRKGVARLAAGAGSGKTKVVCERVEQLLSEGVKPEELLMITFTKNGAEEMKSRIESDLEHPVPGLTISTFNAFENTIVMNEWEDLGYKKKPTLIDDVTEFSAIARLLNKNPILEWTGRSFLNFSTSKGFGTKGALRIAADVFKAVKTAKKDGSSAINAARDVTATDDIGPAALSKLVNLYDKYEDQMKEEGLIDFDDQEILTFKVLEKDPDYLNKNYKYKHIIIDEFQDSSESQIELIRKLTQLPTFESLMVVGDDAQSIYGFRGTTPEYIINFEDYIGQTVHDTILDKNFRSTPQICAFGTAILDKNVDKVDKILDPARPDGMPVVVNGFEKAAEEHAYIVKGIKHHLDNGTVPEDIAVLAFTKAELRKIADLLSKEGIPSMFGAPEPLMENSRIRAILAFSRLIRDTSATADAAICANALLKGTLMDLEKEEAEARIQDVVRMADDIANADESGKKELLLKYIDDISLGDETVEYFKDVLQEKEYDEIIDYLRDFQLYGDGTEYRRTRKYPGVMLSTAHSSKGLEWKVVYNTISKYPVNRRNIEETRRLFFVSATRARD